jgi:adenylate cyclase
VTSLTLWISCLGILLGLYALVVTALLIRQRRKTQKAYRLSQQRSVKNTAANETLDKEQRRLERADEAMRMNQTFQKFVPRQFVDHFAKHGSNTLELGRADEDEVAILFCDIRDFTGFSERMNPQELMKFLNSYFLRMNQPIHHNGGFIDKFIGDAIMALFDHPGGTAKDKASDAVNAALDLQKTLKIYNQHRASVGYEAIRVGIGIHFGPVIIGTVGSDDRMDTTVIGDSVNIAFRLEGLAPKYSADIVVSSQLLDTLDDTMTMQTRLLDFVRVKGRKAPIEIFEILNHLPQELKDQKLLTQEDVKLGLACRIKQDWSNAMIHFKNAQAKTPDDPLLEHHINACLSYQKTTMPSDWDGAHAN